MPIVENLDEPFNLPIPPGHVEDDIFLINDVLLYIAPSSIRVTKQSHNHEWQTLRTRTSQKAKSGHSVASVTLDIMFSGNEQINGTLAPLIAGLRAAPFCAIRSRYLEGLLKETENAQSSKETTTQYKQFQPIVLALTHAMISTVPGQPDCIQLSLDFIWFNYLPYTPIWAYKTGPNFNQPGSVADSLLWKLFYRPFLLQAQPVDWPHRSTGRATHLNYREFILVPKGGSIANEATLELLNAAQKQPDKVFGALHTLLRTETLDPTQVYDVLLRQLNRDNQLLSESFRNKINEQELPSGAVTAAAEGVLGPLFEKFSKQQLQYNVPLRHQFQHDDDVAQAVATIKKRIEDAKQLEEAGYLDGQNKLANGFERLDELSADAKYGLEGKEFNVGGFHLFGRKRTIELSAANDAVIESISISFSNILSMIPMIGYRYPTLQHIGSIDADVSMQINCANTTAAAINRVYDNVETMALKFRYVPQGFLNIWTDNDLLGLFGLKEFMTKDIVTQTVPGQPGRSRITMTLTDAGVLSTTRLRDPDQLRQEFVRGTNDVFKTIEKTINPFLKTRGPVNHQGNQEDATKVDYYKLERTKRHNRDKDKALNALIDRARDTYNNFIHKLHKEIFEAFSFADLPQDDGIGTPTEPTAGPKPSEQTAALLAATFLELQPNEPGVGFVPHLERLKESIVKRQAALRIANRGLTAPAEIQSKATLFKQAETTAFAARFGINRQRALGSATTETVEQELNVREGRLTKLGLFEYQQAMRALYNEIQDQHLDLEELTPIAQLQDNLNLNAGLMAYEDFREQITAVVGALEGQTAVDDQDLLDYDPDLYLYYPAYDGTFSQAQLSTLVDPYLLAQAKALSLRSFENAQGSVDDYFQRNYKRLLGPGTPAYQSLQLGSKESKGNLYQPFLSTNSPSWANASRDPNHKNIEKTLVADSESQAHVNLPQKGVKLIGQLECQHTSNLLHLWDGPTVSTSPAPSATPGLTHSTNKTSVSTANQTALAKGQDIPRAPTNKTSLISRAKAVAPLVVATANRFGLDPALVMAICEKESEFQNLPPNGAGYIPGTKPKQKGIKGVHGACGLMQILNQYHGHRGDLVNDAQLNVHIGCEEIAHHIKRFGDLEIALSAYNWGPENIRSWSQRKRAGDTATGPASPTGKTPKRLWERYQGPILKNVAKWRRFLIDHGFLNNTVSRYTPPAPQQEKIDHQRTQQLDKSVLTTASSPLRLAIDEFTISMLRGQAQSLMRAYPTFKLYFVEDDSNEKRLAFDDFFSYNAVQSIRIIRSRKIAADLCEIYITNVSGVLSNRKFSQGTKGHKPRDASGKVITETESAFEADTVAENPIASLLLQEGQHISLRLGYSADPDRLSTVFNGVITEIEFSESDDLVRIIAQSYAVELVQNLKGFQKPISKSSIGTFGWNFAGFRDNASTGRILEEMMAEPEVLHFGRWIPGARAGTPNRELLTNKWQFTPHPADDNIFAPPPSVDLELTDDDVMQRLKYIIFRTTIWDIFQEMTLRHPNFIAMPVPYKSRTGERMTMFFGLPNQLYFARDPTVDEQKVQNRLRRLQQDIQFKYQDQALEDRINNVGEPETGWFSRFLNNVRSVVGGGARAAAAAQALAVNRANRSVSTTPVVTNHSNTQSKLAILNKNLTEARLQAAKTAGYVRPFRQYHLATSGHHIISNNIKSNSRDVANTIVVQYGQEFEVDFDNPIQPVSLSGDGEEYTLKLDNALPTEDIRTQLAQFINVTSAELAKRYALGLLLRNMKEVYKGDITIIGNPEIKPHDVVFILDEYTDMTGPVEVEQVTHVFDQESGFRTEIKPDMFVQAAEWSLLSSTEALGVVIEGALQKIFGTSSAASTSKGVGSLSFLLGGSIALFGGFMAQRLINYTQLAQPVVMTPLLHHGRLFAGGVPTRKLPTSVWGNLFGIWHPATERGFHNWWESVKDDIVIGLKKTGGIFGGGFSTGDFWKNYNDVEAS